MAYTEIQLQALETALAKGERRVTFGDKTVTSVVFASSQNSFEFDNIATVSAVPEPATWAMMIMGFGLAGSAVRNSRRKAAAAFA